MEAHMSELLDDVVPRYLEALECPRALTVAILLREREWDQLVMLDCPPDRYSTADDYFRAACATDLLRKCSDLPTSADRWANTFSKWIECERQCALTNIRVRRLLTGPSTPEDAPIERFARKVRKTISRILGRVPSDLELRHGPGATFNNKSVRCTPLDKMSTAPSVTSEARHLLPIWSMTAWSRGLLESHPYRSDPETVRGNRFSTAPKSATVLRPIAIEPSINIAYQLATGKAIRDRLFRFGIDLKEGQARHRQVACDASRSGELATIDLSSASDTVALWLVRLLLPQEWVDLLELTRSPFTLVEGRWLRLEKFSSMGNGYTFELETLLFVGICYTIMEELEVEPKVGENLLVYGDDIICPVDVAVAVLAALRWFGFTPNPKKTFLKGPFRESCGGDFYRGVPVRAHFIEELPREPNQYISLANGIRRVGQDLFGQNSIPRSLRTAWFRCLDALPSTVKQCRGPSYLGDLVIHDDQEHWNVRVINWIQQYRIWKPISHSLPLSRWEPGPVLAYALLGGTSDGVIPRGNVSGYRLAWTPDVRDTHKVELQFSVG